MNERAAIPVASQADERRPSVAPDAIAARRRSDARSEGPLPMNVHELWNR